MNLSAGRLFQTIVAAFVVCAGAPQGVLAQGRSPSKPAGQSCEVAAAQGSEWMAQSAVSLRVAQRNDAAAKEMEKLLNSRPLKADVSVGSQLTPEELSRFGNYQQQMKAGIVAMLMESKRERDIRVFGRMAEIAVEASKPGYQFPQPAEGEDYVLTLVLIGSREKLRATPDEIASYGPKSTCDFEHALALEAARTHEDIGRIYGINEALNDLEALTTRYETPLDLSKMSAEDIRTRDRALPVLQMAQAKESLAADLYFISQLEQVSKLMLESRRAALYAAPGDLDQLGSVWDEWVKSGKVTASQHELTATLNLLNEKIPPEIVQDLEAMQSASKK